MFAGFGRTKRSFEYDRDLGWHVFDSGRFFLNKAVSKVKSVKIPVTECVKNKMFEIVSRLIWILVHFS